MQRGFSALAPLLGIVLVFSLSGFFYFKAPEQKTFPALSKKTQISEFEPGTAIVKFKPQISVNSNNPLSQSTNSTSINRLLEKIQAKEIKSLFYEENIPRFAMPSVKDSNLERYYIIHFNPALDIQEIVSEFQDDPGVENASINSYGRILR